MIITEVWVKASDLNVEDMVSIRPSALDMSLAGSISNPPAPNVPRTISKIEPSTDNKDLIWIFFNEGECIRAFKEETFLKTVISG